MNEELDDCLMPEFLIPVPGSDCAIFFEQVTRLAFQRRQIITAPTFIPATRPIGAIASWTPLLNASGPTRVTLSPIFSNFVIPPSEALTEGGNDNSTVGGIRIYKGESSVTVDFVMYGLTNAQYNALLSYSKESLAAQGVPKLSVFMLTFNDAAIHNLDGRGIDIYNFRISSVGIDGTGKNAYNCSFDLMPRWDKNVVQTKLQFNPMADLIPVVEFA